jgi:poly-gamma-glutamate capsule biosynthesis protein CapA/YwtB (metallophosphatase superfamily)
VIQEVEVYKGKLIAYSLGNLVFDQAWSKETSTGLLLEVSFIGEKPLYYLPKIISITDAQAKIIKNNKYDERYEYINYMKGIYGYAKN